MIISSKTAVECALTGAGTPRIPVNHRGFSSRAAGHILGREAFVGGGIQVWREVTSRFEGWHDEFVERSYRDAVELALKTDQDLMRVRYWRSNRKPARKLDEYTYVFQDTAGVDVQVLRFDPVSEQSLFESVSSAGKAAGNPKDAVAELERQAAAYCPTDDVFLEELRAQREYGHEKEIEVAGMGVGIPHDSAEWMEAMLLDPGLVAAYIQAQVEMARKNIAFLAARGFRCLLGGGDFASNSGPMYSPKLFRELIWPGVKKVSDICHEHGVYHFFASDGNLWPVAGDLFGRSGVDVYYEVDRGAGMDLDRLRSMYPRLTLMGNISSQTMAQGTTADIRGEVESCMATARRAGRVIVGVSNYVMPETPERNIDALLEYIREMRSIA